MRICIWKTTLEDIMRFYGLPRGAPKTHWGINGEGDTEHELCGKRIQVIARLCPIVRFLKFLF